MKIKNYIRFYIWEHANMFEDFTKRQMFIIKLIIGATYMLGIIIGYTCARFWYYVYMIQTGFNLEKVRVKLGNRLRKL